MPQLDPYDTHPHLNPGLRAHLETAVDARITELLAGLMVDKRPPEALLDEYQSIRPRNESGLLSGWPVPHFYRAVRGAVLAQVEVAELVDSIALAAITLTGGVTLGKGLHWCLEHEYKFCGLVERMMPVGFGRWMRTEVLMDRLPSVKFQHPLTEMAAHDKTELENNGWIPEGVDYIKIYGDLP